MIPTNDRMTLSWWLGRMSPSVVFAGAFFVVILHALRVPWHVTYAPAIVFTALYALFCVGMFWARKQFDSNRDLRLGVGIGGTYSLVTVLVGMWDAGDLGIASADTFAENWFPFSLFMLVCTTISFVLASYWKTRSNAK